MQPGIDFLSGLPSTDPQPAGPLRKDARFPIARHSDTVIHKFEAHDIARLDTKLFPDSQRYRDLPLRGNLRLTPYFHVRNLSDFGDRCKATDAPNWLTAKGQAEICDRVNPRGAER